MFPFAVDPVFTPSEGERIARDFFPLPIVFLLLHLSPLSASKIDFQFRKFIIHNFHPRFDHILDRIRIFSFGSDWRVIFLGAATNSIRRVDSSWKGWHSMGRRGVALSGRSRAIERSVRKKKKKVLGREGQSELKLLKRVTRWKRRRRTSIQSAVYAVVSLPTFPSPSFSPSLFSRSIFSSFPFECLTIPPPISSRHDPFDLPSNLLQ